MSKGLLKQWIIVAWVALAGIVVLGQGMDGRVAAAPPTEPKGPPACQEALAQTTAILALLGAGAGDVRPKYFLSTATTPGAISATFCGTGFHMASLWEIFTTAALKYDTAQGATKADAGQGPPGSRRGWIRTGDSSIANNILPGNTNCSAYTSAAAADRGTAAELNTDWSITPNHSHITPWAAADLPCDTPLPVWCVAD